MSEEGYSEFRYSAQDGLRLSARIYPPGDRSGPEQSRAVRADATRRADVAVLPRGEAASRSADETGLLPVVCLPGLTRNARDFHELALKLSGDTERPRKVIAFDYRGRGRSAYDRNWRNYDVMVETDDVMAGLVAMGVAEAVFIGTSRGGMIIHVLAALRPSLLRAVILNDVGPVVEAEGLAQIRAYLERAPKPKSWGEAVEIQKAALGRSFPALSPEDWERAVRAIYRAQRKRIVPDYDPKLLKPLMGIDFDAPLPTLWPQFEGLRDVPLLVIRGENSSLLSEATVREMAERHPGMRSVTVKGQGHAPLLETGELPLMIADFAAAADHAGR